jgi:hypothetical protein
MLKLKKLIKEHSWDREFGDPLVTFEDVMKKHQENKLKEGWWDNMNAASQAAYIKKHPGSQQAQQADDDEDDYDMGAVPGSRDTGPWTPEDDPDFEKGSSLTSAPGRVPDEDDEDDYDMGVVPGSRELDDTPEDDSEKGSSLTSAPGRVPDEDEYPDKDPINTKKGEMEDEMEDIASELDNVTDPDEKKELEDRYDKVDQELYDINKKQYGDDSGYEKSGRTGNELNQETLTIDGKQFRRISEGVEQKPKPKYEFSEFYQRFKKQEK